MKKLIVLAASRLFPGRSPMNTTRRFALATLLVLAVAVVLGAPAPASAFPQKKQGSQVKLYPAADSPSPNATGTLTLVSRPGRMFYAAIHVSVSKLAPNASYYMPVTVVYNTWSGTGEEVFNVPIQTDARGNGGGGQGFNSGYIRPQFQSFQVYDASGTLVLTSVW